MATQGVTCVEARSMSSYEHPQQQGRRGSKITVEYYHASDSTRLRNSLQKPRTDHSPLQTTPPPPPPLHPQRRLSYPSPDLNSPTSHDPVPRSRSATTTKPKKSVLGSVLDVFKPNQRLEISTPYDPVHLTHVGFNSSTGEFTGLPKEWQQLLQESGISRSEQEKNPQAVMEIVKFYQRDYDPWDKLGNVGGDALLADFANPVRTCFFAFRSTSQLNPPLPQRSPPPPPKKQPSGPVNAPVSAPNPRASASLIPSPYRPAPAPTPALDRSTSTRAPAKSHKPADLARANTTRGRTSPSQQPQNKLVKPSPGNSTTDLPQRAPQQQQPSPPVQSLAKVSGVATPRRREKKVDRAKEQDIIKRLQQICTDADPTKLYRSLVKIGQG